MPIQPPSSQGFDPANIASKLPRPLQQPVGTALGALKQFGGGDDPNAMMQVGAPMGNIMWTGAAPGAAEVGSAAAPEAGNALSALWNAAKQRVMPAATELGQKAAQYAPQDSPVINAVRNAGARGADAVESVFNRLLPNVSTQKFPTP